MIVIDYSVGAGLSSCIVVVIIIRFETHFMVTRSCTGKTSSGFVGFEDKVLNYKQKKIKNCIREIILLKQMWGL